jgi:undecaprenyl-diphosphatase
LTILESVILGALQGVTEFLPISSSAHLILVPWLFKIEEAGVEKLVFDVLLHFGTLCAILVVYGKRFVTMTVEGILDIKNGKIRNTLLTKICVATVPAAVFGVVGKLYIETHLRNPEVTIYALVAVSVLMLVVERLHATKKDISLAFAFIVGIAQACALVPGASRSGITIAVAMLLGLKRKNAVDFSFLLAIPIILGATLYETRHLHEYGVGNDTLIIYASGALSALIFGLLSLKFLVRFLSRHSLDLFSYYRLVLAACIFFLLY